MYVERWIEDKWIDGYTDKDIFTGPDSDTDTYKNSNTNTDTDTFQ